MKISFIEIACGKIEFQHFHCCPPSRPTEIKLFFKHELDYNNSFVLWIFFNLGVCILSIIRYFNLNCSYFKMEMEIFSIHAYIYVLISFLLLFKYCCLYFYCRLEACFKSQSSKKQCISIIKIMNHVALIYYYLERKRENTGF